MTDNRAVHAAHALISLLYIAGIAELWLMLLNVVRTQETSAAQIALVCCSIWFMPRHQ